MNRGWAIGVAVALIAGVATLVLIDPVHNPLGPEARAMRQLRDASIREPEVLFLRASPQDSSVVCGLARVGAPDGEPRHAYFVSTPDRVIVGRAGNAAVQQALGRHCRGMFPAAAQAANGGA